tara:strand:+ start:4069 stop:4449 length:381 start_codon:yes stop_codon:yes gene_type:complete
VKKYLLTLGFLVVSPLAFAESLYTYDCAAVDAHGESVVGEYFHLTRNSRSELMIDRAWSFELADQLEASNWYDDVFIYEGYLPNHTTEKVSLNAKSIPYGTASGSVALSIGEEKYEYACSLDWSPY